MKTFDELRTQLKEYEQHRSECRAVLDVVLKELNTLWDFAEGSGTCPFTDIEMMEFRRYLHEEVKYHNFENVTQPILEMEHVLDAAIKKVQNPTEYKPKAGAGSKAAKPPTGFDITAFTAALTEDQRKELLRKLEQGSI